MEVARRQDHQEIVPDKLNYLPLLWPMCLFGGPIGAIGVMLVISIVGLGSYKEWFDFSVVYILILGWIIGFIPSLLTWFMVYTFRLHRGRKGSLLMALFGGLVSLVFGRLFLGPYGVIVLGLAGLLSAAVLSAFLPKHTLVFTEMPNHESKN